jgi:uncharacterized protein YukE
MSLGDQAPGALLDPEAQAILEDLQALRERIAVAWGERAVMLSAAEQKAIQREVQKTCDFLSDLTRLR